MNGALIVHCCLVSEVFGARADKWLPCYVIGQIDIPDSIQDQVESPRPVLDAKFGLVVLARNGQTLPVFLDEILRQMNGLN